MLQKGFTLIELMIVVAIIGILSMFALPAYQDYTKRTYVSEGMALATAAKLASTEVFATQGIWPVTNAAAGIAAADTITGQSVSGIEILSGTAYTGTLAQLGSGTLASGATLDNSAIASQIIIHYNQKVTGNSTDNTFATGSAASGALTIVPVIFNSAQNQGAIRWACQVRGTTSSNNIEAKWLPANCRNEAA